jgi:hypothetical protein
MLMQQLFERGIMTMGPSPKDPERQVGVFNPKFLAGLAEDRRAKMAEMAWLAGDWVTLNRVPETPANPAYDDPGTATLKPGEGGSWICGVGPDGRERPFITYDPLSKQWIYVLTRGAFGILRSPGWRGNQIVFEGRMTMIGVDCELRQTWTKVSDDEYRFINEELLPDGSWGYVDAWEYRRASSEN